MQPTNQYARRPFPLPYLLEGAESKVTALFEGLPLKDRFFSFDKVSKRKKASICAALKEMSNEAFGAAAFAAPDAAPVESTQ